MRREITVEGDRGRATRIASRHDAVAEITTEHFAGADLRLEVDKLGTWMLYGYDFRPKRDVGDVRSRMRPIATGTIRPDGRGVTWKGWDAD